MARILVVDDDPTIVRLLRINLELEGHEVREATDGRRAGELAGGGWPDLVLLDIMLPDVDGFAVCEQIRADPATASIPVVLVSARAQAADRARGREVGCSAYVTKPFDPIDLVALVDELLAGGPRPA